MRVAGTPKGEWLETSPEVLKAAFPRGLGVHQGKPAEYACYKGVIVCEIGQSERLQSWMEESMNDRLHGHGEAKVVTGK